MLAFARKTYLYGAAEKLELKGQQTHRFRFMPYRGDWRKAKLPLRSSEFQRPLLTLHPVAERTALPQRASLVGIASNTTIATALFERKGRLFVRLWEWAGQADSVTLTFGDGKKSLRECSHALTQTGDLKASFTMRPWEVKTVELLGAAEPLKDANLSSRATSLVSVPAGWDLKNHFQTVAPAKSAGITPRQRRGDLLLQRVPRRFCEADAEALRDDEHRDAASQVAEVPQLRKLVGNWRKQLGGDEQERTRIPGIAQALYQGWDHRDRRRHLVRA